MNILSYFLINFLYFIGSSTSWSFGVGYYTLYRPVIAGMLTGLILGDIMLGMVAGAIVNIVYLGFVSTGGSLKGDPCLTGIIAAMSTILFNINAIEALAIAFPFGFLGILIWKYRLNINIYFVKKLEGSKSLNSKSSMFIYNALLPQLLLLAMSTIIMLVCFLIMYLLQSYFIAYYEFLRNFLLLSGVFIILNSIITNMLSVKDKKLVLAYLLTLVALFIVNSDLIIYFLLAFLVYCIIIDYENLSKINYNSGNISKGSLFISWSVWMNFSHSCYNFERMQGLAFAHTMRNIICKLYDSESERIERIKYYTDFFNAEPNLSTPIHGYVISLEEKRANNEDSIEINNLKSSMMGVVSGLGDSLTQTVLTPIFILFCIYFALSKNVIAAIVLALALAFIIIYISYTGFLKGYYNGKSGLIDRINEVKNSKVKKYFNIIFSILFVVIIVKIKVNYSDLIEHNLTSSIIILFGSILYQILLYKKVKENYLIPLVYLIPLLLTLIVK